MPRRFPRFRPGEPFGVRDAAGRLVLDRKAAQFLTELSAEVARLGKVSARPPLAWDEGPEGRRVSMGLPPWIHAKLSGSGNPYSFVEQEFTPGTGWADRAGGRSGSNAYEYNAVTGLAGKVVGLQYKPESRDWRFQYVRYSTTCNRILIVHGCNSANLAGRVVTLKQSGVTIASCTTGDGTGGTTLGQCVVSIPAGTYDVSIPAGGDYAAYSGTLTHTCPTGGTTTITLAPDTGFVCGSSTICGCIPSPSSILVTGIDDTGTAISDTCIYNSPPAGYPGTPPSNVWFGQTLHLRTAGNYYLTVTCASTVSSGQPGYAINFVGAAGGGSSSRFWDFAANASGNSCHPFDFPNGNHVSLFFGSGWALSG